MLKLNIAILMLALAAARASSHFPSAEELQRAIKIQWPDPTPIPLTINGISYKVQLTGMEARGGGNYAVVIRLEP